MPFKMAPRLGSFSTLRPWVCALHLEAWLSDQSGRTRSLYGCWSPTKNPYAAFLLIAISSPHQAHTRVTTQVASKSRRRVMRSSLSPSPIPNP